MATADRDPFLVQEVPQHPAAREGKLKVQLVYPTHHRQIGRRHWSGQGLAGRASEPHLGGASRAASATTDRYFR